MSDDDPMAAVEPTDEPDAVQSTPEPEAATPETPESDAPPWGDDFDPKRAWDTITHLRSREKELEKTAKEFERLSSDPEAFFKALAEQLGYELEGDDTPNTDEFEDEDDDEIVDPLARRVAELEALEAQRAEQAQFQAIQQAVEAQFAELGELSEKRKTRLLNDARLLPFTPDGFPDVKAAHAAWLEEIAEEKRQWADSKKAPAVAAGGGTGTQVPDLDDEQQRHEWMVSRVRALRDQ